MSFDVIWAMARSSQATAACVRNPAFTELAAGSRLVGWCLSFLITGVLGTVLYIRLRLRDTQEFKALREAGARHHGGA